MNNTTPIRANVVVLKQMLNLIPRGMINRHALESGVEAKARSFSVVRVSSPRGSPCGAATASGKCSKRRMTDYTGTEPEQSERFRRMLAYRTLSALKGTSL